MTKSNEGARKAAKEIYDAIKNLSPDAHSGDDAINYWHNFIIAIITRHCPAPLGSVEGWKLVPVEPTWEMQVAAREIHHAQEKAEYKSLGGYRTRTDLCSEIYKTMLAAAPVAPAPSVSGREAVLDVGYELTELKQQRADAEKHGDPGVSISLDCADKILEHFAIRALQGKQGGAEYEKLLPYELADDFDKHEAAFSTPPSQEGKL